MIHLNWNAIPSCINPQGIPTLLCIPGLITNVIYWLLIFAGIVALFLIIFSGFKFINSGGDSKAVDSAKKTFTYALLGLILIFSSFAIVSLVGKTFGVQNILQFNFGPLNLNSSTQTNNKPTKINTTNNKWSNKDFDVKCDTKTQTTSCNAFGCKCVPKTQVTSCTCKHPGGGSGSNDYSCTDGTSSFCGQYETCNGTGTKTNPPCKPIVCTCNVNGGTPDGDNGFSCTDGYKAHCSSNPRQYCTDTSTRPEWPCKNY